MSFQRKPGFVKPTPKQIFQPIAPEVEKIGKAVLDAAFKVHTTLGPGLLESVYETTMVYEVRKSGLNVATQVSLPIIYDGQKLESGLRLDMLVEKCVIVELKSVEIMTYLRLSAVRLGFLINFNVKHLKDGIKRFVI